MGHQVRTALVTGASRGIGRGIAMRLAELGYALTVSARDESSLRELERTLRGIGAADVVVCPTDLGNREGLQALVGCHDSAYGAMDALLLSGGVGTASALAETSVHRLDRTVQVNLVATVLLLKSALPLLRRAAQCDRERGARVIALSSISGVYAEPGLAAYGATKAAVISLMETLNAEESAHGVLGTAIAPAYVDTDMSAWVTDVVPAASMIPVSDVVTAVQMVLNLGATTALPKLVLSRAGTTGYTA